MFVAIYVLISDNMASKMVSAFPYSTMSIKSHVPVTLELKNPNCTKWSSIFRSMCGNLGLLKHIDGTVAPVPPNLDWEMNDHCVWSRLYGLVADDILNLAMWHNQFACVLWMAIENLFQQTRSYRRFS